MQHHVPHYVVLEAENARLSICQSLETATVYWKKGWYWKKYSYAADERGGDDQAIVPLKVIAIPNAPGDSGSVGIVLQQQLMCFPVKLMSTLSPEIV